MIHEVAVANTLLGTGSPFDFNGKWNNQISSTMSIVQNGVSISGDYRSIKSADGTVATGPIKGYVDGDLIAFVVHWNEFQALTAWVGQIEPKSNPPVLKTLWQMTNQVKPGEEWGSINAGSDTFTRA